MEAKFEVRDWWRQSIQDEKSRTPFPLANSWYIGANIPGEFREQLVYISGVDVYVQACRAVLGKWNGFEVTHEV